MDDNLEGLDRSIQGMVSNTAYPDLRSARVSRFVSESSSSYCLTLGDRWISTYTLCN